MIESLQKAGLVKDAITSYKLSRLSDGKNDGEITFGYLDPSKYQASTLVTVDNVSPQGFWQASIEGVNIGGTDMGWTNRSAILDTGTVCISNIYPLPFID